MAEYNPYADVSAIIKNKKAFEGGDQTAHDIAQQNYTNLEMNGRKDIADTLRGMDAVGAGQFAAGMTGNPSQQKTTVKGTPQPITQPQPQPQPILSEGADYSGLGDGTPQPQMPIQPQPTAQPTQQAPAINPDGTPGQFPTEQPSQWEQPMNEAITSFLDNQSTDYVSPNQDRINEGLDTLENRKFSYNSKADPAYQQAVKDITNQVLEAMGARGITNSTMTGQGIAGAIAEKAPAFEQAAYERFLAEGDRIKGNVDLLLNIDRDMYGRFRDKGQRLYDAANFLNTLDSKEYEKYTNQVNQYFQAKTADLEKRQLDLTAKQNEFAQMVDKWNLSGSAPNDVAAYFGVQPGTLNYTAQEAVNQRENTIKLEQMRIDADKEAAKQSFEDNVKLLGIKNNYDVQADERQHRYRVSEGKGGGSGGGYAKQLITPDAMVTNITQTATTTDISGSTETNPNYGKKVYDPSKAKDIVLELAKDPTVPPDYITAIQRSLGFTDGDMVSWYNYRNAPPSTFNPQSSVAKAPKGNPLFNR